MTVLIVILSVIAYLTIGAIVAHIGDLYFDGGLEEDGDTVGIAVMWPIIVIGAIIYGTWKLIYTFAKKIVNVLIHLFDNIIESDRNRDNLK